MHGIKKNIDTYRKSYVWSQNQRAIHVILNAKGKTIIVKNAHDYTFQRSYDVPVPN